ncbi:MAG TPA: hypothetical protein PLT36_04585 [Erysipelotrichaceae bacterium]|jgi:hypothetical protein|nr:hypothetical protein [Erysipelotrichaceae bacterium]HQA84641.1 hypothetical protein [Erysipelotrichaceae bacterium]
MEKKIKHLELIQTVINRMANNSFMLKGWAVTLVAGIFVLAEKDTDKLYFLVAYIPIIVFWCLDSYYLLQERLYRALYEKVRQTDEDKIDFSLKATTTEFESNKNYFCSSLFSKTEVGFYVPLALVCTGIIIITHMI